MEASFSGVVAEVVEWVEQQHTPRRCLMRVVQQPNWKRQPWTGWARKKRLEEVLRAPRQKNRMLAQWEEL